MSLLYNIFEWITRLLFVNLLWIIFSIPAAYLLVSLMLVENSTQFIGIVIFLIGAVPFFLFPATVAMFGVVRKWVMKELHVPVVRSFWKFYKENYKRSLLGGFIIEFIWIIFIADYYYFTIYISELFLYPFIFLFMFLMIFTLHFMATTVHFKMKLFESLKSSVLITIGRPFFSFGLGITNILIIYISINHMPFLIPTFIGTLIAFVSFSGFHKVYVSINKLQEL